MIGDDAQGHVDLMALAVMSSSELAHLVGDIHDGIDVEQGVHILAHDGKALEAHARVDVLLLELGVMSLAVVVELGEHDVPDLDIAVAVAADGTARLAAAVFLAAVIVDLGAWAARAGAVLPEIVLFAELEDAVLGDAYLVAPDGKGLVIGRRGLVARKNGRIEPVRVEPDPLGRGEELPGPVYGLPFEIVAEREIAEHLEESAVARGVADVLDITGADALLAGGDSVARGLLLAGEPRLHGSHAGVYQQQRRVVLRDEREAGQTEMFLGLEELEKHLAQLVQSKITH